MIQASPSNQSSESTQRRTRVQYSFQERESMKLLNLSVKYKFEHLRAIGVSPMYESQDLVASKVLTGFKERRTVNIAVIAKTQSGKTGTMGAIIYQHIQDEMNPISAENVYIITALSSCEWRGQTRERIPNDIKVYHRDELNHFVVDIKERKNVLIIMDEIQVASKQNQSIYNFFKKAGLLSADNLYAKDVKICEFTATPDGTIFDLLGWDQPSTRMIRAEPGEGYKGAIDLYDEGRVRQYKPLCGVIKGIINDVLNEKAIENIQDIKQLIYEKFEQPMYHIVRTGGASLADFTITNFKYVFHTCNFKYIKYDQISDIIDINNTLSVTPTHHTFIFIKEKLRCAKSIKKEYLGVLYDRCSNLPDDAAVIQALIGRATGYDDNGVSVCYTNVDSVTRYEALWQSYFTNKHVKWNSKTTRFDRSSGRTKVKCSTFNDPVHYNGNTPLVLTRQRKNPFHYYFQSQEEVKIHFNSFIKPHTSGRGPNTLKPDANGWFCATINKVKKPYSKAELETRCYIGNSNNKYWYYPCYTNLSDQSTLTFCFIHEYPTPANPSSTNS